MQSGNEMHTEMHTRACLLSGRFARGLACPANASACCTCNTRLNVTIVDLMARIIEAGMLVACRNTAHMQLKKNAKGILNCQRHRFISKNKTSAFTHNLSPYLSLSLSFSYHCILHDGGDFVLCVVPHFVEVLLGDQPFTTTLQEGVVK